jgi:hypothetical protein
MFYKAVVRNANKFSHGFGMFQYNIQFFKGEDPDLFLKGKWATWDGTFGKGIIELWRAVDGLYGASAKLSQDESVFVAIAYNRGVKGTKKDMATKRFKQGHKDSDGVYYGEHIDEYLKAMKGSLVRL